jgi:uncharacterized LabA/DUF88 family protein
MNGSPKLNSSNKNYNQNSNHSNAETRHVEPFKLSDYQRFLARSVENVRQSSSTNQVANEVNYNPPPGLGSDPLDVVFKPMNDRNEKNDRYEKRNNFQSENPSFLEKEEPIVDRGRIAVFIDGSNLFFTTTHHLQFDIDFTKLVPRLIENNKLVRACYYTGNDPYNEKQQKFFHMLRCTGYKVVTKDLQTLPDGNRKVDLDVEMAVDMLNLARSGKVDTIICISGDGDLAYALHHVAAMGVRVEVVSYRQATHESLIYLADKYTDLSLLKDDISKIRYSFRQPESRSSPRYTVDDVYNSHC